MNTPPAQPPITLLLRHALTAASQAEHPRILGIDGPSGAGKTRFADAVAVELLRNTGTRPQVVHMDDIYPGWTGLAEAVDVVAELVLEPLFHGREAAFRRWDWALSKRTELVHVPPANWIILEGVGSGSRRCRPYLTALAWLEADHAVRMARGLQRDGDAFRPHWEQWSKQEDALFAAEGTRAHATIHIQT